MNYQIKVFFFLILIILSSCENNFIVDYFGSRKTPNVVGFSCNVAKDDISLIKSLNQIGVAASLNKLSNGHRIDRFAHTNYWKLGVFLDMRCSNSQSIVMMFSEATEYRMYDELHYWLILSSKIDDVLNAIDDKAFGISTDFVIAIPSGTNQKKIYDLYDTYNLWKDRGTILKITFLGSWTKDKLNINVNESKFKRRANLQGIIISASFYWSKYKPSDMSLEDYLQDYATTPKDGQSKFGFIVLTYLAEMFNFTLKSGTVAKWEKNDIIGPVIRAMNKKEVDITGSPAIMTVTRTYMAKFLHQSFPFRTCFIFRSPQPKDIKIHEIFGPFEAKVWYIVVILFLLSIWVMSSVFRYEHFDNVSIRYSNSFLVLFGAICQQGTDIKMNHVSTRIAFFYIMLFSVLLYNYYSASVVTTRLNEPIFKLNDSLYELSKTNLKLASEWMVYFELLIKKPDFEISRFYKNRWAHVPEDKQFMQADKAIPFVRKGDLAYHMHPDVGYPIINREFDNREICELTEVHLSPPQLLSFAVDFNSTIAEILRVGFIRIAEVGIQRRQIIRWTSRKPHCNKNILSASSISIYEFSGHLLILTIGMALATVTCIVEKTKQEILKSTKGSSEYMIPETGMRFVQKGGFAYHTHPDIAYPIIERQYSNREICELMEVHVATPTHTCFGVSMNSSIDEISRVGLIKISETGLSHRQVLRWQYRKPRCYKDILSASSINIYEFAPHLLLLLMGIVIAFGIYAIEVVITEHKIHRLNLQMSLNVDANSQEPNALDI